LIGFEVRHAQQGLVVEHFLKMRHQPDGVRGIAVETEADLVEDPPPGLQTCAPSELRGR
jgi:hypothetical protein